MKTPQFAIVDIETTGGNASTSRITEIAIIIHDGTQIIDRWESLVNPQKEIPPAIFALTGIDNRLVRHAPLFSEIAADVFRLLTDRVFVAHNVNFDYSFIRHELEQAGFKWTARKLCTVRATRKIKPGLRSYSLGNLCSALDITIENRHRAGGDANATAILFSKLLEWDTQGELEKMIKKTSYDQRLPPNLPPQDFENLPEKPGVYYFYNRERKVVYVGKAVNLKKRVASHFSGHKITSQRQHFLKDIHSISFEVCATELMALLLECSEIKKLWPVYNTALKRFDSKFGLFEYQARSGYRYLATGKISKFQTCLQAFNSEYEGVNFLLSLAEKFKIDHRFCKYGRPAEGELVVPMDMTNLPDLEQHNTQIDNAIASLAENRPSFAIIDQGRSPDEKCCIWVEDGTFYGMGYISSDASISELSEVRESVTQYHSNGYLNGLVFSFTHKNPSKVFRIGG